MKWNRFFFTIGFYLIVLFLPQDFSQKTESLGEPQIVSRFRNLEYFYFSLQRVSYEEAKINCTLRNATLLIISDNETQQHITQHLPNSSTCTRAFFYMGLFLRTDGWHWIDGTPLNFTNWKIRDPQNSASCSNEPNGFRGCHAQRSANATQIGGCGADKGFWFDRNQQTSRWFYICQRHYENFTAKVDNTSQETIGQGNPPVLTISSSQSANLTSPGWPAAYPRDEEYSWFVNASQDSDILVTFLDFETIPPDHVLLLNNLRQPPTTLFLTGSLCQPTFRIRSFRLAITFSTFDQNEPGRGQPLRKKRTVSQFPDRGFRATFTETLTTSFLTDVFPDLTLGRCIVNENLTLGGTPLRVNSPELTRPSSLPRECNYTVSAPVGTIINASFNTFGLSEPNRLEVYDGSVLRPFRVFEGFRCPTWFLSTSNRLVFVYRRRERSDDFSPPVGFQLDLLATIPPTREAITEGSGMVPPRTEASTATTATSTTTESTSAITTPVTFSRPVISSCNSGTNPCQNGGTCSEIPDFGVQCNCPARFTGPFCAFDNPCFSNSCRNGGTCTVTPDFRAQCLCPAVTTGAFCEEITSQCVCSPCVNGGTCIDRGEGAYTCNCRPGFTGVDCHILLPPPCLSNPCLNGGTCIATEGISRSRCICPPTASGDRCELLVPSPTPSPECQMRTAPWILPNCTTNQALTNFLSCANLLFEGIPYSTEQSCYTQIEAFYQCARRHALQCFGGNCPYLLQSLFNPNFLSIVRRTMNSSLTLNDLLQNFGVAGSVVETISSYICPLPDTPVPLEIQNLFGNSSLQPSTLNLFCDNNTLNRVLDILRSFVTNYFNLSNHEIFCNLVDNFLQDMTDIYTSSCLPCTLSILLRVPSPTPSSLIGGPNFGRTEFTSTGVIGNSAGSFNQSPPFLRPTPPPPQPLFSIKDFNGVIDEMFTFLANFQITGCPSRVAVVVTPPVFPHVPDSDNRPSTDQCSDESGLRLFPSCTVEQSLEAAFSCLDIYLSRFPYNDRQACRATFEDVYRCVLNAAVTCFDGNCSYILKNFLSQELFQGFLVQIGAPNSSFIDVLSTFLGPAAENFTETFFSFACPLPGDGVPEEVRRIFGNISQVDVFQVFGGPGVPIGGPGGPIGGPGVPNRGFGVPIARPEVPTDRSGDPNTFGGPEFTNSSEEPREFGFVSETRGPNSFTGPGGPSSFGGPLGPNNALLFLPCDVEALVDFFRSLQSTLNQFYLVRTQEEFCRLYTGFFNTSLSIWTNRCDSCFIDLLLRSIFPQNRTLTQQFIQAIDIAADFLSGYEQPQCRNNNVSDRPLPSCPNQIITHNNQNFSFGKTNIYEIGSSVEICEDTKLPRASATCLPAESSGSISGVLSRFDESTIISINCGVRIADIMNNSIEGLPILATLTSSPEVLNETDIETATEILGSYLSQSEPEQINETTLGLATRTISNLLSGEMQARRNQSDTSRSLQVKSQLLQTLNGFASSVNLPEDTDFAEVITPDITVQVRRLPEGEVLNENGIVFNLMNLRSSSNIEVDVFVESPTTSQRGKRSPDSMNDCTMVYATSVNNQLNSAQITSQVVSTGVRNCSKENIAVNMTYEDVEYLPGEVIDEENPVTRVLNQASFVRWDFAANQWTSSVCDTAPPSRTLSCNQLATYSILFSRRVVPSIAALAIVSYVGTALSIVFLLLTIFIYASNKELREKPTTMTLINICVCLVLVYLFFAIGVGRVSHHQTCNGLTFILHYFTLACFAWMSINAYQMLRAFTSMTYSIKKAGYTFYIFAYGLPFVVVMIDFALTVLFLDRQQVPNDPNDIFYESLYRAKFTCWLQEPSFYWAFILPVGLLLVFNIVVFIILLKKIMFRKREIRSTARDRSLVDRLVNAITMVVMMGLTWIFGYFLLIPVNVAYETAMQWLFTIFNVFQGLVIFYMYCLRRANVRSVWISYRSKRPALLESSTSGTSKTGESKSTTSSSQNTKNTTVI